MDPISRIGVFLEVVKQQSFAGAARALGTSGPAVSKQVQALENQLGVKLLRRTTRQVSLTEEGAIYSERAGKALADLREAKQQIQEMKACPTGRLKINAPMSFGRQYLVDPIARFAVQYPDIDIEVDFDDRWVDIVGENYDLVVRIGALSDSSLIARKLADCPISICASPDLISAHGMPKSIEELSNYPAVIYTKQNQSTEWRYEYSENSHGETGVIKLHRNFAANNAEMQLEACIQGLGIAPLPVFASANALQSGQLVALMPGYEMSPRRGIYALYPQNRHLSTRVRLLVDWLVESSNHFPW